MNHESLPLFTRSSLTLVACLVAASCSTATPPSAELHRQDPEPQPEAQGATLQEPSHASLDLGASNTGISIGNSENWNGIRLNYRDHGAKNISGLNLTLWAPLGRGIDDFDGIAIGGAPSARDSKGLRLGLAATVSHDSDGIEVAGVASVAQKDTTGIRVGGIATVAGGDSDGIGVAGIATVNDGRSRGLHVGGIATVADGGMLGIHGAGIATVSGKDMNGIQAAGIAAVADGDMMGIGGAGIAVVGDKMTGIHAGGIATVAGADMLGVHAGGVAAVAEGGISGITAAGVAVVAEKNILGLHAAGIATVSQGSITGIGASGLSTVSQQSITGIEAAGIAMVAEDGVRGLGVAGLFLSDSKDEPWNVMPRGADAEESKGATNRGILVAGLRADATVVEGLTVAGLINRSHDFDGIGISAHNSVSGMQRGLQVGVFNYAEDLRGVQVGVLNYVPTNPWFLRWLPLVNFRF